MKGKGRTIIIQPVMISPLPEWEPLCEDLSTEARVILYNRAGCGKSDKGIKPRNRNENAKDLKALIDKLCITSPVIIGHSYGGLILQQFALDYPNLAAGFIFVDSTSMDAHMLEDVEIEGEDGNSTEAWIEKCKWYATLSKEDLLEEVKDWISEQEEFVSESKPTEILEFMSNPIMFASVGEELHYDLLSSGETNQRKDFPETSTIIIGRDPKVSVEEMIITEGLHRSEAEEIERIWQYLIRRQTKFNTQTEYFLAENSGHSIHMDKAEMIRKAAKSLLYI